VTSEQILRGVGPSADLPPIAMKAVVRHWVKLARRLSVAGRQTRLGLRRGVGLLQLQEQCRHMDMDRGRGRDRRGWQAGKVNRVQGGARQSRGGYSGGHCTERKPEIRTHDSPDRRSIACRLRLASRTRMEHPGSSSLEKKKKNPLSY